MISALEEASLDGEEEEDSLFAISQSQTRFEPLQLFPLHFQVRKNALPCDLPFVFSCSLPVGLATHQSRPHVGRYCGHDEAE